MSEVRLSLAACESPCVRLPIVVRLSASWVETWACPSTRQHSGLGGWLDLTIQFSRSGFLFMFSCGRACSFLEGLSPSEPPDFHWRTASRHHYQPTGDSLSPLRRSGERVRERGFKRARQFDGTSPSPPALSPLVPRREREKEPSAMVVVSRCAPFRGVTTGLGPELAPFT